jgi:integrase
MTGRVQHLVQHSGAYLFRRRLPEPLARLLGRTHIKRSLATRDRRVAIRRAREASARIERLRAEVEQAMSEGRLPTREELTAVLAAFFRDLLEVGERRRDERQGRPYWMEFREATEDLGEDADPDMIAARLATLPPLEPEDDPEGRIIVARQDAIENRRAAVEARLDRILAHSGVALPKTHPAYARLCRLALRARVEAAEIDAARECGDYSGGSPRSPATIAAEEVPDPAREAGLVVPTPSPAPPAEATPQAPRADGLTPATPLLSEAWREFCAAKQADGEWRDHKTALDAQRALRLWLDLMEDKRTGEIDRKMALAFRTKLRDLPARNGKSVYVGLSPSAAIALAKDIAAQLDRGESVIRLGPRTLRAAEASALVEPISFKSCNKILTFFTAFGSWAEQNERREWFGPGGNPFTRLLYRKQTIRAHRDSDKARQAMPDDVLPLLFSSPVWAGRDPHADILEGNQRPRDAKFWLPFTALYSGMRLSKIAQLRLADIRTEQGVAFFAVLNTAETSTKTPSSERFVPIHRELIRLGLMDRVAELTRRGERRLFPEIVARATQGDDYGATFSR